MRAEYLGVQCDFIRKFGDMLTVKSSPTSRAIPDPLTHFLGWPFVSPANTLEQVFMSVTSTTTSRLHIEKRNAANHLYFIDTRNKYRNWRSMSSFRRRLKRRCDEIKIAEVIAPLTTQYALGCKSTSLEIMLPTFIVCDTDS